MIYQTPCDRCGHLRALTEVRVRLLTGRLSLRLCVDCVTFYNERHQIVGPNLPPIGAQTAPLLRPGAAPSLMPRVPTPPALLPPEVRRLVEIEKESER